MSISRYNKNGIIKGILGPHFGSWRNYGFLRDMVESGQIKSEKVMVVAGKRLEHYAYEKWGDASYWWIITLVNGIGFAPQVRPGTEISLPNDINDILIYFK